MQRVDGELAGKRAPQRLVGGDQHLQPFVDLTILPLAPFLDGHHQEQAKAHADDSDERQARERGQDRVSVAEVDHPHSRVGRQK